jgi:hypothetical protein
MDPSLKPDPLRKGSYYRRLEDVPRALESLESNGLSPAMRFFIHYFGCEKIARGIVGIHARLPAKDAYHHKKALKLELVKAAAGSLGLSIPHQDLDWLFADFNEQHILRSSNPDWTNSARYLRNNLTHDFGPSNVARVSRHAPLLNPKLDMFLSCVPDILKYQRLHFAGVA